MKQTTVEWLEDELGGVDTGISYHYFKKIIKQAKEMEKQQIVDLAAKLYEGMYGIDGKEYAIDYYNKLKE